MKFYVEVPMTMTIRTYEVEASSEAEAKLKTQREIADDPGMQGLWRADSEAWRAEAHA